ncbi:MAG: hypothetical protein ACREB9_09315, partial [Thermoplasmata archaeon]
IGKILFEQGSLSEGDLASALSEHLGLPLVDLGEAVPPNEPEALLPEPVARKEVAVPIGSDGRSVMIAVADPTPEVTAALESAARQAVRIAVAPRSEVVRVLDATYHAAGSG